MELRELEGTIIGVYADNITREDYGERKVSEIVVNKQAQALKMVGLGNEYLDKSFNDLSIADKSRVRLASKLQDKVIIVNDLSLGLTKKEIDEYKKLLKKISLYGRKIIVVDKCSYMFLELVDNLYVINKEEIIYHTKDIFDINLEKYMDVPKIVEFNTLLQKKGIRINHYTDFDELLKAIYRIKS